MRRPKVKEKKLRAFLRTPKTAKQIVAEFGLGCVTAMRWANDRGHAKYVMGRVWQDGWRFLYVVEDPDREAYNRRRFAQFGADWRERSVV